MELTNLVGFLLPIVIDFINKRFADHTFSRWLVTVFVALIAAVATNWSSLYPFDATELFTDLALIFTASQVTYQMLWRDSQVRWQYFK